MSYVVDLYRKQVKVQKNPLYVALYIALFPQLIAGPIVRYQDIESQIETRQCSAELFWSGTQRFIYGLGKKVLLANQAALVADGVFALSPDMLTTGVSWLGIVCYALQIYFDFSGYSDMAIGLGRMFGFRFLENFDNPYISRSVKEFWRRWHISLSTWFRDYLYIPLGGSRRGNTYVNLVIVFLATGLWHGASWTFVFWGLWHGLFLILERLITRKFPQRRFPPVLGWLYTALVVLLGWVLFRSPSMTYALSYARTMFTFVPDVPAFRSYLNAYTLLSAAVAIVFCLPLGRWLQPLKKKHAALSNVIGCVSTYGVLLLSMMQVLISAYNPFIYFRF